MSEDAGVCAHAVTNTQSDGYDGEVAGGKGFLGDQLNAADDDGREHHDGSAAQNSLGHDGNQSAQLGAQAAQNQEDGTGGNGKTVDNLGHGNQTHVLAEGGVGQHAEQSGKGRAD